MSDWLNPDERAAALAYLEEEYGVPPEAFEDLRLYARGEHVYAVRRQASQWMAGLTCVAAGLRLLKRGHSGGFRPATRGVQVFGTWATKRVHAVGDDDLRALLSGAVVPWDGEPGEWILHWHGCPVGLARARAGQLQGRFARSVTEHLQLPAGQPLA